MQVNVNWQKSPDGTTHGLPEGAVLDIKVSGVHDAAAVILKDFSQIGHDYHGTPILIPAPKFGPDGKPTDMTHLTVRLQRQGMPLKGKKYLLKTIGHDAGGQSFEADDIFEIW